MPRDVSDFRERLGNSAASLDAHHLLHELQLHESELEQQNQELREMQQQLSVARDRYRDLYEGAPVGYMTLDSEGRVAECNLMADELLTRGTRQLAGRPLSGFVARHEADRWHIFRRRAAACQGPQRIVLTMQPKGGDSFQGQLDCLVVTAPPERAGLRVTLTDVSPRQQVDDSRAAAQVALAAQEAARRRVSRELHDDLGQRLSAVKMALAGISRHMPSDKPLDDVQGALDEAVDIVRRMAAELRPLMLDDLGISACVEWLAKEYSRRFGLDVKLSLAMVEPDLDERTALTVFRALERVLIHVFEQTGVVALQISLHDGAGGLVLDVRWDMVGGTEPARMRRAPRQGLQAHSEFKQGAALLGYQVEFVPGPADAQRIIIRFPSPSASVDPGGWALER